MQLIKNNFIITFAIFLSLSIHIVILLYNKSENVIKENIVYFELVKQAANTDVSAVNEKIIEEVEKVEENKKIVEDKAEIPKKVVKKQEKKKAAKRQDIVKAKGKNNTNNQAEMYIKQNYTNIHQQIISNIIYPPRAKKLGIEGSGYLLVIINKDGSIISVKAYDFPNKILSEAAIKAAKKASKTAAHQLSSNVEVKIPVTFKLK